MGNFTLGLWSELLPSYGGLAQILFPFLLKIDKFHDFPAFPLLFWHERFLLCRISCLQVDLKRKKQLVSYHTCLMVYNTLMM